MPLPNASVLLLVAAAVLGACAAEPRYGEVVTMKAGERPAEPSPGPGTVWRLDAADLNRLSPAPLVPAPPPPNFPPPPRPGEYHYPPPPPPGFYY